MCRNSHNQLLMLIINKKVFEGKNCEGKTLIDNAVFLYGIRFRFITLNCFSR